MMNKWLIVYCLKVYKLGLKSLKMPPKQPVKTTTGLRPKSTKPTENGYVNLNKIFCLTGSNWN